MANPAGLLGVRTFLVEDALGELAENSRPGAYVAAARAIAELRLEFEHDGQPDWGGQSAGWLETMERIYAAAGIPADSGAATRAKLRFHLGEAVRHVRHLHAEGLI